MVLFALGDTDLNLHQALVIEVHHQRMFYDIPVKRTDLDVVIETLDEQHVSKIMQTLDDEGYKARLLANTRSREDS